jgi:hypothetical protein
MKRVMARGTPRVLTRLTKTFCIPQSEAKEKERASMKEKELQEKRKFEESGANFINLKKQKQRIREAKPE